MCLQDLQIARSLQIQERTFTSSAGAVELLLPEDNARVGFVVLGPNADPLELRFQGPEATRAAVEIDPLLTTNQRVFSIWEWGPIITKEIHGIWTLGRSLRIVSYQLPLDQPNLYRLAQFGRFGQ